MTLEFCPNLKTAILIYTWVLPRAIKFQRGDLLLYFTSSHFLDPFGINFSLFVILFGLGLCMAFVFCLLLFIFFFSSRRLQEPWLCPVLTAEYIVVFANAGLDSSVCSSSLHKEMLQFKFWLFFLGYFHNVFITHIMQYEELSKSRTIWFWQMLIPLLCERRVAVRKKSNLVLHTQAVSLPLFIVFKYYTSMWS